MIDPISLTSIIAALALGKASWSLLDQIREYNTIRSKGNHSKIRVELKDNVSVELDLEGDIHNLSPERLSEFLSALDSNASSSLSKFSKPS